MTPPVAATARMVSSRLLRTRSSIALALAWVRNTGLVDARAASSASAVAAMRQVDAHADAFISATSLRPKRVSPPPRSSRQPSPARLASLYVSCAMRRPIAWKAATRSRREPNGSMLCQPMMRPVVPSAWAATMSSALRTSRQPEPGAVDLAVPFAERLERALVVPEHVGDGDVGGGDAAFAQRRGIAVAQVDEAVDHGRAGRGGSCHAFLRRYCHAIPCIANRYHSA